MLNMTETTRHKIKFGKLCTKHPEFKGERWLIDNRCVECQRLRCKQNRQNNKDKVAEYNKMYKAANREKVLAKNREYMHIYKNTEQHKLARKLSKIARERKLSNQLIANLFKLEIANIYRNCPIGHHVDHIIPINGKNVSGLHVPWNMQYLLAEENLKKSNKLLAA